MCIKTYSRHSCCDARANTGTMQLCRNFVKTRRCQKGRTGAWNGEYTELACSLHANFKLLDLRVSQKGGANRQARGHRTAAEHPSNGKAHSYVNGYHKALGRPQKVTACNYVNNSMKIRQSATRMAPRPAAIVGMETRPKMCGTRNTA